ncbi:unnamed protein product [Larinioides sclopetarius]|uniref:Prokineticin domain-containing protein n=1 Tax=Larinioides sclopetarius TaxID=280406 RepID=A0AAV1ZED6_9ARAC
MCTKMILGCLLLLFVVGYVSACNSQEDCPLTHCCAKKAFVEGEYNCVPYREKNELCLPGGLDEILYDGRYDINCPCKPGLSCVTYQTTDGRGSACNSQEDCPLTHCCAKKAFVEGEYNCVPYREKYELCLSGGLDEILYDGRYDINCPCKPGLLCVNYQTTDGRGGFIANGNPHCRNVTEDRILKMRQNEMQSNSIAGA